jgi:hypothetical protein
VDIPDSAGVERSCIGAIHLLPKRPRNVTEGELEFIQANFPGIALFIAPVQPVRQPQTETVADGTERQQDDVKMETEPEPIEDSGTEMSETVVELLELSIPKIMEQLEQKQMMMDSDEYDALLREMIDVEKDKSDPRSTLVEKLAADLD